MRSLKIFLILGLTVLFSSCASLNLTPIGQGPGQFQKEDDEARLWKRTKEEQERLEKSGVIYENISLEDYLNSIAAKLLPQNVKSQGISFKIKVIQDPFLNAFSLPDGTLYIHTGMLARIDNEAQAATVLAHEMVHTINRHLVKEFRSIKNKTAFYSTFGTITAPVGGDIAVLLGAVTTLAAITGYSRELETEADQEGFKLLVAAGYDPAESVKVFQHLKDFIVAEKLKEPFFFSTHPHVSSRIENFQRLLKENTPHTAALRNEAEFISRTQELLLDNARFFLYKGRFEAAKKDVEKFLAVSPQSAKGNFYLGEVFRKRAKSGDAELALDAYKKAAAFDPLFAPAHRESGIIYYKQGKKDLALNALKTYLSLEPNASDKGYIENYIKNCLN